VIEDTLEQEALRRPFKASRHAQRLVVALCVLLLAACSTVTKDGPEARPPADLDKVPDATPRIEPIRDGGPNKPYEVLGRDYTPLKGDAPLTEKGLASWYGKKFQGRRTASGEVYNMYAMTAAHKTMPLPSYARVRNPANGREIVVRVNDRGPFVAGRIIDLSYTAAMKLGVLNGIAPVEVERITPEQIRNGSWQRDGQAGPPPETVAPLIEVSATTEATASAPAAPQPKPDRAFTSAAQGYWVQLGAFRARDGAEQFQRKVSDELGWLSPLLAIFSEPQLFRLQAGPYPTRNDAQDAAGRIREALKLVPVVIERR
jgi:rare lipoprotein A